MVWKNNGNGIKVKSYMNEQTRMCQNVWELTVIPKNRRQLEKCLHGQKRKQNKLQYCFLI